MSSNQHAIVIGGGVAGLGAAWRLVQEGWEVDVFDRHTPGFGASTRAAGMLAPAAEAHFEEELQLGLGQASLALYPDFVRELQEESGVDVDYRSRGTLVVGIDRDDAEALAHMHRYHRKLELPVEQLTGDQAREIEPGLSPTITMGLFCPSDHQVHPQRLMEALAGAFKARDGRLHTHTGVRAVRLDDAGGRVRGVTLDDGSHIDAANVLVANGAWARKLEGIPRGILPHIRAVRGQVLVVGLGDPPLCQHVIRAPDAYLVPRTGDQAGGELVIGATSEERGFDNRLTAGGVFELLRGAWETLPGIYDAPILDQWVGFRPVSLANLPALGPTSIEGLFTSLGHGRNGILLAPLSADALSAMMRGEDPHPAVRQLLRRG
ncbi:glycine oxidase ThiO [Lujinxingia vulgaris]|uniref:Glycine oxidase ThiO n=1 Tax=Lujinxingia vulgaris TaxID=2600176 RepID=A0A5C6XAY6_9DELT|nr:glycine oxidase ThiO [Lujinxingia vulgaris]TXD35946.1 glycine oxidase ThiO [Lujinxingia vulgaris]